MALTVLFGMHSWYSSFLKKYPRDTMAATTFRDVLGHPNRQKYHNSNMKLLDRMASFSYAWCGARSQRSHTPLSESRTLGTKMENRLHVKEQ